MEAFERALPLPPAERGEFLRSCFPGDPAAQAEVAGLLGHHDHGSSAVATAAGLDAAGSALAQDQGVERETLGLPALRGEYRIVRTIGEGGMGIVFEAEQAFPRRRVAVKAMRPGFASRGMLRRFRNEAEFLGKLQHPNIAQIYEAGVAGTDAEDQAYFVMELVRGDTLLVHCRAAGLSWREKWELLLKVCDAIQHAHQRGVIHRDLKPANILVDEKNNPKVVDFGIARAAELDSDRSNATREGQLIGTPSYMSPEQLLDGDASAASDIYALGVIAYELFTGRLPFDLSNIPIARGAALVGSTDAPMASQFDRSLRGDAETIIAKAMAKEPRRRYASAEELAADIRGMLRGDAILARRDSAMYVLGRQVRRYRTASALIAAAVVALVSFAVFANLKADEQGRLAAAMNAAREEAVRQRVAAEEATADAIRSKTQAERAEARARDELTQSTIERGRMAAATGNLPLAEDTLWREYLANPGSLPAQWALWEMYDATGSNWATGGLGWTGRAAVAAGATRMAMVVGNLVKMVDVASGEVVEVKGPLPAAANAAMMWPDGSRLVLASSRGGVVFVGLSDQSPTIRLEQWPEPAPVVRAMAVSKDGRRLALAGVDKKIRVWDAWSGQLIRSIEREQPGVALDLSQDGTLIAIACEFTVDGTMARDLAVFDVATGAMVSEASKYQEHITGTVRFASHGPLLYLDTAISGLVAWNYRDGVEAFRFRKPRGRMGVIEQSPDGTRLLVADRERMFLVDAQSGAEVRQLPMERYPIQAAGWVSDDEFVVGTSEGVVRSIDAAPSRATLRVPGLASWSFAAACSEDSSVFALSVGSSNIDVFDSATRERVSRATIPGFRQRTRGLKFLRDNRTLVAGSQDGCVRLIDGATGTVVSTIRSNGSEVYGFDVDPAERLVAIGHFNRRAEVYDLQTGKLVADLPVGDKRVEGMAFSPSAGLLVYGNKADSIAVWSLGEMKLVGTLPTTGPAWNMRFSPDGARLFATTSAGTIDVFDMATRMRVTTTQGHTRLPPGLAVSRDGLLLATGGEEGYVKLWDAATLRPLASFTPSAAEVVSLAFSPDGRWLVAGAANFESIVFDLRANADRVRAHEGMQRARQPSDKK
ncbi:protein kinase domain-containing protein [Synechococcus sp. Cruz CV-v-12]|uniref:protein kinase domain-containing protein n=1 Tax=Synechococcus sp. Cruz CV-v-12 TaxID=2823728 RepID=UPI0020CF543F|nr:protein kinase [Synechococcus sp. Cruz CV-v-12]